MPFTPKFVDLVRNSASVTGTGPITLGAAAPGFTSLADAAAIGEQFYYCLQGIDKPSEREVGRGTMQANGTVAREAIEGPLTSFTAGSKSIALVAAAEWFRNAGGGASGIGSPAAESRTAIAAEAGASGRAVVLREAGREGLFLFQARDLSAMVAADPRQAIYIAPASDPSGASGAWTRQFDGPANVLWWGATPGVGDSSAAIVAAVATLRAHRLSGFGYASGSVGLRIPASRFGAYHMGSTTLELNHSIIIEGDSSGGAGGGASVLSWNAGTTGIRLHNANTVGATGTRAIDTDLSAAGSIIRNLQLVGNFAGSESEAHGIHLRTNASIRDCYIRNFAGDGIHSTASFLVGGAAEGNSNCSHIDHVFCEGNRNGLSLDGADANAFSVVGGNFSGNRQWGIRDSSFLGNHYSGGHCATNGVSGLSGIAATRCVHNGRLYYVINGQEAGAATNSPSGTSADNAWWAHLGTGTASPSRPAWASGMNWRAGGSFCTDDNNNHSLFSGMYQEPDQNPAQTVWPALVVGGHAGSGVRGPGQIRVSPSGIDVATLTVQSHIFARKNLYLGTSDAGADFAEPMLELSTNGNYNFLSFKRLGVEEGYLNSGFGGLYINGTNALTLRVGTAPIAALDASGITVTGRLAASGAVTGSNLSGVNSGDQTITLSGDVSGSGTGSFVTAIGANKVGLTMLAQVSSGTFLGRATAATGNVEALTAAQAAALLPAFGAAKGLVPGVAAATDSYLRADATFSSALTPASLTSPGAVRSSGATAGIGYATGAGGTVTQATSKSTSVTLNRASGQVVMNAGALAAATSVSFTLTNSAIAATDTVNLNICAGATANSYLVGVDAVAAGSCRIHLRNISAASLAEALVLNFALIKAVAA